MDIETIVGGIDLANATFIGLMTIGFVNVVTMLRPSLSSTAKFALSVVFAFALTFVPPDIGNVILDKVKVALEVAFASSGAYKVAQRAGGI